MKLIEVCAVCKKPAVIFLALKDKTILKCGHEILPHESLPKGEAFDFSNSTGTKEAYEFQKEGIKFLAENDYCGLIADSMGLGKTIQAALCLKNAPEKLFPSLIVVKSATGPNWLRENYDWLGLDPLTTYFIQGKMPFIPPGFKTYVISMDSLSCNIDRKLLLDKGIEIKYKGPLFNLGLKSIVVDECHSFKNDSSLRTRALIILIKGAAIKHRIFLSGTPIKNRADEFFVTLNLIDPLKFPSRQNFRYKWLEQDEKRQWSRLNHFRAPQFHEMVKKYYLRREKTQVLKNLPSFARYKSFITIEDQMIKNSYNAQLKVFDFKMRTEKLTSIEKLGELARLRRITGMAKIQHAIEFAEEWFEDADLEKSVDQFYPDKLAIGIHHKDVRTNLKFAFDSRDAILSSKKEMEKIKLPDGEEIEIEKPPDGKPYKCLTLSGENSAWEKQHIADRFVKPEHRILVVNELAGGVGLNLQMCANTLVLERQWNAADEEQFESRFHRDGQTYPVTATYMIANGTIDEYFDEMVERKRAIFQDTLGENFNFTSDENSMNELINRTLENPLK